VVDPLVTACARTLHRRVVCYEQVASTGLCTLTGQSCVLGRGKDWHASLLGRACLVVARTDMHHCLVVAAWSWQGLMHHCLVVAAWSWQGLACITAWSCLLGRGKDWHASLLASARDHTRAAHPVGGEGTRAHARPHCYAHTRTITTLTSSGPINFLACVAPEQSAWLDGQRFL